MATRRLTLRDKLLPTIDRLRELPDAFGLRRYTVTLRRRRWASGVVGRDEKYSWVDVAITPKPRVRLLSTEEVASSGGTFTNGDMRVDKITPKYLVPFLGGYAPDDLKLVPKAGEDVCILLEGDDGKGEYQIVQIKIDRAFTYSLVVRSVTNKTRG